MAQGEEQQQQNNDYVSEPFSYTMEQRQNRKNHVIKGYSLYYVAQNLNEPPGEPNRVEEGYWCLKKYEMQAVSLLKPTSGSWVVLPTGMHQTTVKVPVEYASPSESVMVETLTGGLGTSSLSSASGGGVMIKNKSFETDDYHFDYDTDIYASKLKEQAESEGYLIIPAAGTRTTVSASLNTNSSAVIPTLFAMGKQKNIFDEDSKLFEDIAVNRIFSENYPVESNPEDGSTIQRMFHAFVPRHGGEQELPPGLLPDENERKKDRMLREIGSQLQKMKEHDTKAAALLMRQKVEAEREYQKKLAEITSRLREGTIEEMTSGGAVDNADTQVEEEEQEDKKS